MKTIEELNESIEKSKRRIAQLDESIKKSKEFVSKINSLVVRMVLSTVVMLALILVALSFDEWSTVKILVFAAWVVSLAVTVVYQIKVFRLAYEWRKYFDRR